MPKRSSSQWEGQMDDAANEIRQSILNEMATGVNFSIEFQDSKIHTSQVWRYFGVLLRDGIPVRSEMSCNYCAVCLQEGMLFKYSKATANGNLLRHLKCAHNLELEARRRKEPKPDISKPTKRPIGKSKTARKSKKQADSRDSKFNLAREITLWLAKDLRPLNWIKSNGMKEFLKIFGIIGEDFEMPRPNFIYRDVLEDVYIGVENRVKEIIAEHGAEFHLTIECYSDNLRQLSHLSCTIHWVDLQWNVRQVNLGTSLVEMSDHNTEIFSKLIVDKLKEYGVEKVMFVITDDDLKMTEASNALEMERLPCMAGSISEVINKDLLQPEDNKVTLELPNFQEALAKLRTLHRELIFRIESHEKIWNLEHRSSAILKDFMESYSKIESILDSEERIGDGNDGLSTSNIWITNWYLCDHFIKYKDIIETLGSKDAINESDYKIYVVLKDILSDMVSATEILTGSKYSALSSSLLFRSEIVDSLEKQSSAAEVSGDLFKKTVAIELLNGVVNRFVISDATVCAAIVDPAMKDLGIIEQYMAAVEMSKHDFIKSMLVKHKLLNKIEESKGHFLNVKSEEDSLVQREEAGDSQKHKKLRLQLLTKHSNTEALSSLDFEIRKYLLVSDSVEDPITWWKSNGEAFPHIKRLARLYLGIPATVLPFDRAFSTTGIVETAARTNLCPTVLRKTLFIHDNYQLVSEKRDILDNVYKS